MSRWKSAEEYFAARDAFALWVCEEVNTQRTHAGLARISATEARDAFDRVDRFMQKWTDDRAASTTPARHCEHGRALDPVREHCAKCDAEADEREDSKP